MIKKNVTILLWALFLLIGIVTAAEDFDITAAKSISLCPCSGQTYTIGVKNTGSETSTYSIISSDASKFGWASPYPNEFTLKPGQKTGIPITVNSLCNIFGKADFEFIVFTKKGLTKKIQQAYIFNKCYNYSIHKGPLIESIDEMEDKFVVSDDSYNICSAEKRLLPVLVKNEDNLAPNRYKISLDGDNWASLPVEEFELDKGKSGVVFIELSPPESSEGSYEFTLRSATALGNVEKDSKFAVNVQKCHIIDMAIVKKEDVLCSGDLQEYIINLQNLGESKEILVFSVEGADWASMPRALALDSNSGEEAVLRVKPVNASGEYAIKVTASSPYVNKSDSITLNIEEKSNCYNAEILSPASISNSYSTEYFPIKIKNTGTRLSVYEVLFRGPDWISAEPKSLELKAGQQSNINLRLEPKEGIPPGTYTAALDLRFEDISFSKDLSVKLREKGAFQKSIGFIVYYRYYFYLLMVLIIITFINIAIFRWKVIHKLREKGRQRRIRKKRLEALKKAREARRLKVKRK